MRLDLVLVKKGLAVSRTQAQEMIKNGHVFILAGEKKTAVLKPNCDISEKDTASIWVEKNEIQKFVSRGGLKLKAALNHLQLSVKGKAILDVGQSTGGFTDCLLQHGAASIVGIDVGRDQLHGRLKDHPGVTSFESLHVNQLLENEPFLKTVPNQGFDLLVADVSFISLTKVMLHLKKFLKKDGDYLFLVKPQFEAGSNALNKNGIVKDEKTHVIVQTGVTEEALKVFGCVQDYFKSDLPGKDGNQEFLFMAKINFKYFLAVAFLVVGCSHKRVQEAPAVIPGEVKTAPPVTTETLSPTTEVQNYPPAPLNTKVLPKFAFIFSGGGAKAWAHIGFLKELQKLKWPVQSVAGFEWGAVVAAIYAQNLSANEVEWEMSKLKEFDKSEPFLKTVFEKKNTADLKVPFVCPSLNLNKQSYYLLNRGQLQQLIPFCVSQPPLTPVYSQSVAVMTDVPSLAQHLRSTGANRVVLVNVLAQQKMRSFVSDYASAENILWVEAAALMAKKPVGVDEIININLDDYGIKDLDKRRDVIAKGAELSYDQLKKLALKYGL